MKKKLFFFLALVVCALSTKAQDKWTTEVYAGAYTLGMWDCKNPNSKPEIKLGVNEDYALNNKISLVSGIAVYKDQFDKTTSGVKTDIKAWYIQVPLNVRYYFPLGEQLHNAKLSFECGPYVSCGLGGKTTMTTNGAEAEYDTFGAEHFHHLEAGMNTSLRFHYSHVILGLSGRWGITPIGYYGSSAKSKSLGVQLGYEF